MSFTFALSKLMLMSFFIAGFVLWVWSIVDIVRSDFKKDNDKLVFLIIVLLTPLIGTIVYLLIGTRYKMVEQDKDIV